MRLGIGLGLGLTNNRRAAVAAKRKLSELSHELILPTAILSLDGKTDDGAIAKALSFPWLEIFEQLDKDPNLLHEFSKYPRKFEEFIAASYEKDGYSVTLTSQSGDGGKDIIAEKRGFGAFRIIDQCKAFKKGRKVDNNDVRAMMGTLLRETNASKAVITTTTIFAPSVSSEWKNYMPNRLELRDKSSLLEWLQEVRKKT